MTKLGTVTWTGQSGVEYEFTSYPWGIELEPGGGVYVITRRRQNPDGAYKHLSLYVGQAADLVNELDGHAKSACFEENGANCVCVFRADDEGMRLRIEGDLMPRYRPRCNG